jgi:ABC-2 type transport system permease protein
MDEDLDRVREALAPVDDSLSQISWYPIAKKEFQDTVRTKSVVVLWLFFLTMYPLPIAILLYTDFGGQAQGITALIGSQATAFSSVLVPIAAVALSYSAISAERERGSLKILLSLPYTRSDVVVGKAVGRTTAVALPLVVGIVLRTLVIIPANPEGIDVSDLSSLAGQTASTALLTVALATAFIAIGIGFSAAARSSRLSIAGTFGLYFYFFLFWNSFANGVSTLLQEVGNVAQLTALKVTLFIKLLNPTQAYKTLVTSAGGTSTAQARLNIFAFRNRQLACQEIFNASFNQSIFGGTCEIASAQVPFYLTDAAIVVYLLAWIAVPLVLGYRAFAAADL